MATVRGFLALWTPPVRAAGVIDTHCHLDKAEFQPDRDAVLERAHVVGVNEWIVPATGPRGWAPLLELARSRPGMYPGLGVHPQLLPELDPRDDDRLLSDLEVALEGSGAVGVGECGLDGPSARAGARMERQVAVLEGQLAIARRLKLPVMLHALRTLEPLLAVLERDGLPGGGVIHSFSGSVEQVLPFARLGLYFAFAGPLTYPKARKPISAVRAVPPDRLLIETDAPDQTPWPKRGRNEPAYLPLVAAAVASALDLSVDAVDDLTTANARRLFHLQPVQGDTRFPSRGDVS